MHWAPRVHRNRVNVAGSPLRPPPNTHTCGAVGPPLCGNGNTSGQVRGPQPPAPHPPEVEAVAPTVAEPPTQRGPRLTPPSPAPLSPCEPPCGEGPPGAGESSPLSDGHGSPLVPSPSRDPGKGHPGLGVVRPSWWRSAQATLLAWFSEWLISRCLGDGKTFLCQNVNVKPVSGFFSPPG